jgi:arylsulfatase A-like enzyme
VTLFEQEGDATPWYLYFAPQAPHISAGWLSYAVPETKYADAPVGDCVQQGEPDRTDKPAYMSWVNLSRDHYLKLCQSQIRALLSVDDELDLTMRHLQSTGELDNTLVVFTSDNGYLWNDHNRQSKFVPYEASIRVPLWLRWPGRIAAGSDARLASNIDVLPTILAAANITPKTTLAPIDGRSLTGTDQRIEVLSEYWYDPDSLNVPSWAALRSGTRKYVETYETDSAGNVKVFRELYDLTRDPGELANVLRDGNSANDPTAGELSGWSTRLAAARTCSGTACP